MKKLIFSAAILLGTMSTFATPLVPIIGTNGIEIMQDGFTEIAIDAVPAAVTATIGNSFPGAKLLKAYSNENKEYKLEIAMGEKSYTVFTDAEGKIIKK
ncbi:hypothetical protein ACRASX_03840 [Flavobacterium sp. TMP13]|uniref:hypothetical protein n=1 Tax=unclassified Flavobacterium TaxID=196869 RepID=UPI00076D0AA1|nr:hypothetical protein [Flavobacterium sp. TAB 87]KVV13224.1 hypothetical protein AP058_02586 [Flavobacterium sp. TAB 87]